MACCVLIGGMFGLIFAIKARLSGDAGGRQSKALEWRLHQENDDDKE